VAAWLHIPVALFCLATLTDILDRVYAKTLDFTKLFGSVYA
jgi:hypothetical protein